MKKLKNGRLKELCPFLDEGGIIRVGGRLKRAKIPYQWKHHITLPAKHDITTLAVKKYYNYRHLGPDPANISTSDQRCFNFVNQR